MSREKDDEDVAVCSRKAGVESRRADERAIIVIRYGDDVQSMSLSCFISFVLACNFL